MNYQLYRTSPGQCRCSLGDPYLGSLKVPVALLSGAGALIKPAPPGLKAQQFVYSSLEFENGPALALSGVIERSSAESVFIRWEHASPGEAEKAERTIRGHLESRGQLEIENLNLERAAAGPSLGPSPGPAAAAPRPDGPGAAGAPGTKAQPRGKIDIGANIRKSARKVRAADLASRLETVQVIGLQTIKRLIRDAVDEAVMLMNQSLAEAERERLLAEVEESFRDRYESEKAGLEGKVNLLQKQLEKAQAVLENERQRVLQAQQFTVSDEGILELEQRLSRLLDLAVARGGISPEVESEMRAVVARLLDDERKKILEKAREAQSDRIALLEKKVHRLSTTLESAEKDRDSAQRWAQALEAAGGIPLKNIYAAGLGDGDPDRERKLSLLKEIVEMNRDLRKELAAAGKLPPPRGVPAGEGPAERKKGGSGSKAPPGRKSEVEEAKVARSLGIQRRGPPGLESPPPGAPAPEGKLEEPAVPPLATGPGADPDDLPWEPEEDAPGGTATRVKIKRLGE